VTQRLPHHFHTDRVRVVLVVGFASERHTDPLALALRGLRTGDRPERILIEAFADNLKFDQVTFVVSRRLAPIPAQSPFIPVDAKIVVGAVAPASPEPIPIVLLPGFEYRMREWRHPDTHEVHWLLERRKSAQQSDDDE
jgi:hypothetical protein